jgi:hypothetical protein
MINIGAENVVPGIGLITFFLSIPRTNSFNCDNM